MADELYRILNVGKEATSEEIRTAHRALVKKHHPDLNPGDKSAEETFKKIQSAYDILSDPETRQQYDLGEIDAEGKETPRQFYREYADGDQHNRYASHAGYEDFSDIFSDLFGNTQQGGKSFRMRGGDLRYEMEVDFLEAINGAKKRIEMPDGKALDITIPAGHRDGQILRLRGKGMPGHGGGSDGDAYIEVHVKPHPDFRRDGRDILLGLPIAVYEAVLGAKVEVPTIRGPVTMTIPPGSNTGDTLRLKGKGVTSPDGSGEGAQLVTLRVVLPEKPDSELSEFLEAWSQEHSYNPRTGAEGRNLD